MQKLGDLQPARFREIAEQERRIWTAIRKPFEALAERVWAACDLPGSVGKLFGEAQRKYEYTADMDAALQRAASMFVQSVLGLADTPDEFASPANAIRPVSNALFDGEPILPGELRTAFRIGIDRAVQVTHATEAALSSPLMELATQEMMQDAFKLLSDGARIKLADVLTATGYPGGSVKDLLMKAMEDGQNPLQTARDLRRKFKDIQNYNWARLARTETAFAQNGGALAEYEAEHYVVPTRADGSRLSFAPYHPNCVCGVTIDVERGYVMPDVSSTACWVCQAHLSEARIAARASSGGG